jgi:hypothetical protein
VKNMWAHFFFFGFDSPFLHFSAPQGKQAKTPGRGLVSTLDWLPVRVVIEPLKSQRFLSRKYYGFYFTFCND